MSLGTNANCHSARSGADDPGRCVRWLLVGVILLGTGLIFHDLGGESLWLDEIIQAQVSSLPLSGIIVDVMKNRGQPPLYWLLLHFVMPLGRSEFSVRLLSAMFGVINIAVVYKLGEVLLGRWEGTIAAFLLAISPFHLKYAQDARMYTAMVCFSGLSLYWLYRAMQEDKARQWIGYAACSILNLWNHTYAAFVFGAEVAFGGMWLLWKMFVGPERRTPLRMKGQLVRGFLASSAAVFVLWTPILLTLRRLADRVSLGTGGPLRNLPMDVAAVKRLALVLTGGSPALRGILAALLVLGLAACLARHRKEIMLLALWVFVPAVGLYFIRSEGGFFSERYVSFLLPLFLILIAKGLVASCEQIARFACWRLVPSLRSGTGIASTGLTIVVVTALAAASISSLQEWYQTGQEDWRGVAAYLEPRLQEGDVVLCDGVHFGGGGDSRRTQRALLYYLDSRHPSQLILKETEIPRKMTEIGDSPGQVWGVVYRGWRQLKPAEGQSVVVADFHKVSVIRLTDPAVTLRDNSMAMLGALMLLMPQSEALTDLELALGKMGGASLATSHVLAGDAYMESGDVEAAIAEFEAAIRLDPSSWGAHRRLGDALRQQGRADEAIGAYHKALQFKPSWDEQPWMHLRLANTLVEAGRVEEAVEEYSRVLELSPNHEGATRRLEELQVLIATP